MAAIRTVSEVMTKQVVYLPAETTVDEAAQAMRSADIGDVVVTEGPALAGILTDRDIVVRAVAENQDPRRTTVGSIATHDLVMIQQDASPQEAARLRRRPSAGGCRLARRPGRAHGPVVRAERHQRGRAQQLIFRFHVQRYRWAWLGLFHRGRSSRGEVQAAIRGCRAEGRIPVLYVAFRPVPPVVWTRRRPAMPL
jgi:CBS domain-containing protein